MRNTQKKNLPELRFPGFEGEWEEKQFADFTKINQGLQIAINERKTEYSPELYFYITNEFLRPNSQTKYFIENPPQSVIANKEDILMTRTGNTGKVVTNVFGAFHNNFFKIKFDKNLYDRLFLVEVLNSSKIQNKILSLAGSSTIPDLNHSDFYSISSSYPLLREQQKIGKFFSKLDRQIELEEQKLELLKQQKKGYMQKIFSQELRFKDENGNDYPEWEKKKLKEIACVYTGNTPSKKENIYWNKGEYVWVTPTDINNSKNIYESEHKLTQEGYKKARQLPENTLLVTCIASIGKNAILRKQGSCNQQINAVVPFENINIDYLYYISDSLSTFMKSIAGKTATQIVNKNTFENLKIYLASFEEQKKIADLISSLEELIEKQASKLIKMKSRKQGMLQIMFI
ncbi:restriction endonuclease subunit S [Staphylococcus aureus]|uniref:restriction endonuclease subunit S n=1 Tax=Staphylococcus aureus TaxID=1280 RepID=UPI00215C4B53|nr:restriction endonuclease subunit S [Staphylococcus aureus]UVI95555.1 restriction endonuclease subunit S [Staphylococcus aureus]UVI98057.1 restriction endonuclease subunit S [Staphylococcus aureus]UVJ23900.1 restriction endonuclease subunit S [Staphylococcus aureus]